MSNRDLLTVTAETKLPLEESYSAITIEAGDYPDNWKDPDPRPGSPAPADPFRATPELLEQLLPRCEETFTVELPLHSTRDTGNHGVSVVKALLEHGTHLSALHVSTAIPPMTADIEFSDLASNCFYKNAIVDLLDALSAEGSKFRRLHTFSLHVEGDARIPHWMHKRTPALCARIAALTGKVPNVSIYATMNAYIPGFGVISSIDTRNKTGATSAPQSDSAAAAAAASGSSAPQ